MGVGGVGYIMNSRLTWATQKEAVSKDPKRNGGGGAWGDGSVDRGLVDIHPQVPCDGEKNSAC